MNVVVDPGHRVTVEEYEQICAAIGLERVELIDGVIYELSPESVPHVDAAFLMVQLLLERYPDLRVRQTGSIRLGDLTLLQPDVYVSVPRAYDRYPVASDLLVAVEVALTTWAKDMGLKLSVYARAGIPEYWVVDPKRGGKIIRHSRPVGAAYAMTRTVPLPDGLDSIADAVASLTD